VTTGRSGSGYRVTLVSRIIVQRRKKVFIVGIFSFIHRLFHPANRARQRGDALLIRPSAALAAQDYATRAAYVDAVVSVAQSAATITQDLMRRMYRLFAEADLSPEDRINALDRMFLKKGQPGGAPPEVPDREMAFSLVKDVLDIGEVSDSTKAAELISHIVTRFRITPEQVAFLTSWTEWENRILEKLGKPGATVSKEDIPIELGKKAAAVGVPVAALYFSGSVVGFSAAGITSGLAAIGRTLGLVGLGLNPMTAGIVGLIVGGIAVKKILDALFPSTRRDAQLEAQRAQLEQEARRLKELRDRCVALLKADADAFSWGRWWEIFTGRRRRRRMAVQLLRQLAASEEMAAREIV
jgi:hypothetical protein